MHFDHAVDHQSEEGGEKRIDDVWLLDKLDLDRQMAAIEAGSLMTVPVMMVAKTCFRPKHRRARDAAREEKREDLLVNEIGSGAGVFVEMDCYLLRRAWFQHGHCLRLPGELGMTGSVSDKMIFLIA